MLVLHYTGMPSAKAAIARLCDPVARVSSHYVVDEDGAVVRLVPESMRAWHAGISAWRGRRGLNDVSIGVEIVNPGHEWGYRAFPDAQIEAVEKLCLGILSRWPIPRFHVVGHSDIAPNRKQDPGELFPWKPLAAAGVGIWPEAGPVAAIDALSLLKEIGYDIDIFRHFDIVTAFQRHWRPSVVNGEQDADTQARIAEVAAAFRKFGRATR